MKSFIFLFLFLQICASDPMPELPTSQRCYVSKNNYVKFYATNENSLVTPKATNVTSFTFESSLCGADGYSSFAMSSSPNPKDWKTKFIFFDQSYLNYTDMRIYSRKQEIFRRGNWRLRKFTFLKDAKHFAFFQNSTIIFSCHTSKKPFLNETSGEWIIPEPEEVSHIEGSKGLEN
jgi:hypothetical protein